jgi:CheY-like chemotaxis protein
LICPRPSQSPTQLHLEAESFNYRVVTANNGAKAIAICARQHIDLLLTDIAMPIMDGNALIAAVRSLFQRIKVIGASGLAETFQPSEAGVVNAFIHKPYTAQQLVKIVREVLDGAVSE